MKTGVSLRFSMPLTALTLLAVAFAVPTINANPTPMDYGDAPDSYGTLDGNNGARHLLNVGPWMGASVDEDSNGQPGAGADGDDLDGNDDEDGVTFTSLIIVGFDATIDVNVSGEGYLNAWLDFDGNGVFDDTDQVLTDELLSVGTHGLSFEVPSDATPGPTYARFRFSPASGIGPTGGVPDGGEVEDYAVDVLESQGACGAPGYDVPDSGAVFDFTEACVAHDQCYAEGGNEWDRYRCDRAFYSDMNVACQEMWDRFDRQYWQCRGVAQVYYLGVRLFGGAFFSGL